MQKYKSGQVGHVLGENLRDDGFDRARVDPGLTRHNYDLSGCPDARKAVRDAVATHERTAGRRVRKDANVAFSWVVTLPIDVLPGDERAFFEAVHAFEVARYGAGNCIAAVVHRDEPQAREHMHSVFTPLLDGRLQASKMVDRSDLQTFHGDLSAAVEEALGYHVSIELEDKAERQLSKLGHEEYKAAKDEIKRARLEADLASEAAKVAGEQLERVLEERNKPVDQAELPSGMGGLIRREHAEQAVRSRDSEIKRLGFRIEELEALSEQLNERLTLLQRLISQAADLVDKFAFPLNGTSLGNSLRHAAGLPQKGREWYEQARAACPYKEEITKARQRKMDEFERNRARKMEKKAARKQNIAIER